VKESVPLQLEPGAAGHGVLAGLFDRRGRVQSDRTDEIGRRLGRLVNVASGNR